MKHISYDDYLRLVGLLTLARDHNRALEELRAAALRITDERDHEGRPDTGGHTADEIYDNDPSADKLLDRLNILVSAPEALSHSDQGGDA